MIELIFVIVILGILAAVAIPRLAATRDDAEVAKSLSNLGTAVSDITANYTAQGSFDTDDISAFTNVEGISYSDATKLTALKSAGAQTVTLNYPVNKKNCATISLMKNNFDEITIFIGTSKLLTLQKAISTAKEKVKEAEAKDYSSESDPATAKTTAVTEAKEGVTTAKKALTDALAKTDSTAPAGADSSCRSLVSASSFRDMAGKEYQLSGSRVRF
ncbi:type II secretion system protein [Campylobacter blaseri]